jgi:hypothetical protein
MNTVAVANLLSSAFALSAAVLWLLSALVKTPSKFPAWAAQPDAHVDNPIAGPNPEHAPGTVRSEALLQLGTALRRQSAFSAWAAGCACIAAAAQAVALW